MQLIRAFDYTYDKYPFTMLAYCIMTPIARILTMANENRVPPRFLPQ